jgi:hypothetical protein
VHDIPQTLNGADANASLRCALNLWRIWIGNLAPIVRFVDELRFNSTAQLATERNGRAAFKRSYCDWLLHA